MDIELKQRLDAWFKLHYEEIVHRGTQVWQACADGYEEDLRHLLRSRYDMEQRSRLGWTPAFVAAMKGHDGCLRLLHEFGCDIGKPQGPKRDGRTPAYVAAEYGHEGCLRLLHELDCIDRPQGRKRDGRTPAYAAAENGHEGCLRLLHELGCNMRQARYKKGWTPALVAAFNGHEGCLLVLLQTAMVTRQEPSAILDAESWRGEFNWQRCLEMLKKYSSKKTKGALQF